MENEIRISITEIEVDEIYEALAVHTKIIREQGGFDSAERISTIAEIKIKLQAAHLTLEKELYLNSR